MKIADFFKFLPASPVYAHCDVPCGIYDPHQAQLACKTVLTMVQKINDLKVPSDDAKNEWKEYENSLTRMILVKEQHAQLCKSEVLMLWTDYFKPEHLRKFPQLHELVWRTAKLCSENKRVVDETKALELTDAVNQIAEIFEASQK